jgi:hypothetical protein
MGHNEEHDYHRAEQLEQAASLIRGVVETLDGSRHRCTSCGIDVLRNKDHGRKVDTLSGIVERLDRMIGSFRAVRS